MTKKSARKSPIGRPFVSGDPRSGRGPKKGAPNAGRPRKETIAWCQGAVSDPKVEAAVMTILRNPKHGQFSAMWGKVMERGYGKPVELDEEGKAATKYVLLMPPEKPV